MRRLVSFFSARVPLIGVLLVMPMLAGVSDTESGGGRYSNERFGFSFVVPGQFRAGKPRDPEFGGLWLSQDRRARLIAVAAPNEAGMNIEDYRTFVIEKSYPNAKFTYAPMKPTWFVLSGRMQGQEFYERILFQCGGRYIYGWQMIYPVSQRKQYDRLVEAVHRSYRPGRGEDGACGPAAGEAPESAPSSGENARH